MYRSLPSPGVSRRQITTAGIRPSSLATAADLGRKGAAFAPLGEIPVDFFPFALTLSVADKKDGVKLGESTLNDFFILSSSAPLQMRVYLFHTSRLSLAAH
jgi:hypothetical protein